VYIHQFFEKIQRHTPPLKSIRHGDWYEINAQLIFHKIGDFSFSGYPRISKSCCDAKIPYRYAFVLTRDYEFDRSIIT
jgi:hypothetical protein